MKKWFFMLICMVAFVLPQDVWAQTTTSSDGKTTATLAGTTLTVTCNATTSAELGKVGETVNALLTTDEAKAAVTEIKFVGNITSSDLSALGSSNGFTAVTAVDMGDAHIIKSSEGMTANNWTWYQTSESGSVTSVPGSTAIFGGTLYQYTTSKAWTRISEQWTDLEYSTDAAREAATPTVGTIAKVPSYMYCQMQVTDGSWSGPVTSNPGNVVASNVTAFSEADINNHLNEYNKGQSISFIRYFKKIEDSNYSNGMWIPCTKDEYEATTGTHYPNMTGVDLNSLLHQNGAIGDGMWCYVYYTKNDSRSWTAGTETAPTGVTIENADFLYSDRNNHLNEYSNNQWVKMNNGYTYWQYSSTGAGSWTEVSPQPESMADVTVKSSAVPAEAGTDGQYAAVGGAELFYTGSEWKSLSNVQMVADFGEMKFSYWSNTLKTATTSRYADASISSEIFQNCNQLTRVNYLGGHVKGLGGRTNSYENFTLFVGKDVTDIDASALSGSTALVGLEFDKTYTENERQSRVYPKELTIGASAFQECYYLDNIEIPNRCVSIGERAFYRVGNKADNDINNTKVEGQKMTLSFERRNSADDGGVGINCDFPLQIGTGAFLDCWYLESLSLPIRLESLGNDCFKNTLSLTTLEMREETQAPYTPPTGHDLLRTIPSGAFEASAVSNVKIPKCVTLIEDKAFGTTRNLSRIDFQTNTETPVRPLVIKTGAFAGGTETGRPQLDIYIDFTPEERMVVCEYNAFNHTQTVGQTSVDQTNPSFSYLHFPEEAWDYYQGDWKRGLAFKQESLNSMKDGYTGPHGQTGETCAGKAADNATINLALGKYTIDNVEQELVAPANGWQQFARTKTGIDIELPKGEYLRTYSTKNAQIIPTFTEKVTINNIEHAAGSPMFKVYRVSDFSDCYNEGDDTTAPGAEVTPKATATEIVATVSGRNYIPPCTGVLLEADFGASSYVVYFSDVPVGSPVTFPYNNVVATEDNRKVSNLLYPSCIDNQPGFAVTDSYVSLTPTVPYPYYGAAPDYRIFGLWAAERCFSRVFKDMARDKAYLKLPASMFHYSNEGEKGTGQVLPSQQQSGAPIMLSFLDPEGETTAVRMLNPETMSVATDCYYTLQGMKLSARPTEKGIYIYKGKKVVIK
ncbi:MAG: leucine-rich repeat protein [Prevotella sp.]|nr:leucine-rich repeat protein [Prevotella sp.]